MMPPTLLSAQPAKQSMVVLSVFLMMPFLGFCCLYSRMTNASESPSNPCLPSGSAFSFSLYLPPGHSSAMIKLVRTERSSQNSTHGSSSQGMGRISSTRLRNAPECLQELREFQVSSVGFSFSSLPDGLRTGQSHHEVPSLTPP